MSFFLIDIELETVMSIISIITYDRSWFLYIPTACCSVEAVNATLPP